MFVMSVSVEYFVVASIHYLKIMSVCNNNNNNNFICTLNWFTWYRKTLGKNIERVQATHNNHLGLKI